MRTICMYNSKDLDGWLSAAIVKHWFKKKYPKALSISNLNIDENEIIPSDEVSTGQSLYFMSWNYEDDIPDLSKYGRIIMCGVSFPISSMEYLADNTNLIWIDHHVGPIRGSESFANYTKGLRNSSLTTHELTWLYFFADKPTPKITKLIEIYNDFKY